MQCSIQNSKRNTHAHAYLEQGVPHTQSIDVRCTRECHNNSHRPMAMMAMHPCE